MAIVAILDSQVNSSLRFVATSCRLWGGSASKYGDAPANGHGSAAPTPEALLGHKIDALLQLEDLSDLFSRAFLASGSEGGVEISTAIAPELAGDVYASFKEAEAKTQVGPSPHVRGFHKCP